MNDNELKNLDQVSAFLAGSESIVFTPTSKQERYAWLTKSLRQFNYHHLRKRDKGIVRQYLKKMTGYSRQQLTRLIAQHRESHTVGWRGYTRHRFSKRYTETDIVLLAKMDRCHQTLSGPATKKLLERAYHVFGNKAYERLAAISVSHLYNLRGHKLYQEKRRCFTKTHAYTAVSIGEKRKPNPCNEPGYLRIDTVHQGDQDGQKGVYHINAVDEVTQMEVVCAVERITQGRLVPALALLIQCFPFKIKGIHSDNGKEYINKRIANLLKKLLIELTKSRPYQSTDNALVEGKNGSVIRKHLGYVHIPQHYAAQLNVFYENYLNPYINYHRPCFFAVTVSDSKGKARKTYPYDQIMTPYERFKSLPQAARYLRDGLTFTLLDEKAMQETDMEAGRKMQEARKKLFSTLFAKQKGGLQLR